MIVLALAAAVQAAACPQPANPTPPAIAIPEAGLDDPSAYEGYRTRFYRDSHGNAVQVYIDARSGRVVALLANASDESAGFTARDARGKPAEIDWGADAAGVRDSGNSRIVDLRLRVPPGTTLGWFVLGSMRVERDVQYGELHRRPFAPAAYQVPEESLLVARLAGLPAAERARHLALLGARTVDELRTRLRPSITEAPGGIRIARPGLDARSRLTLELRVPPREGELERGRSTVVVRSGGRRPVCLSLRIITTAYPLGPLNREQIFTPAFLDWLARARAAGSGGDTAAAARARRLERLVRGVELLSSREKLMAGLPNFATYFGRDMMMTALMMREIWRPEMSEHVIASALRKLGPLGQVSHEEALGGQAIREAAVEYAALIGKGTTSADTLERARALLRDLRRTRENYHMLDDEFQLPVLTARWLADTLVADARKREFLSAERRLPLLLKELTLVARLAAPYADQPSPRNLVGFERLDSTRWRSSSWRDSDAGYAGGRYAMDINAIWVPHALEATAVILRTLPAIGFTAAQIDSLVPDTTALQQWLTDSTALRRAIETWGGAGREFAVRIPPAEAAGRIGARLAALPDAERRYWRAALDSAGGVQDTLAFSALALDSAGVPIPVVNTDPATEIFLDSDPENLPSPGGLEPFLRDYPVGLFVAGIGPVAANDAYAEPEIWERWRRDRYHSPWVVWGREVNLLLLGLAQKIIAADRAGVRADPALRGALEQTNAAVDASGMSHNELWSYRVDGGRPRPMRYGSGSDVQLWNTTDLAVQYALSRLPRP